MSELDISGVARVTRELEQKARDELSEGEVLTLGDCNGFELGVLAIVKTIKAAGGELPTEEQLKAAIPEGIEAASEVIAKVSTNLGSQAPESIYIRI